MTPHLHSEHVPGCYRCDLSADETLQEACPHPHDQLDEAISHLGDPNWAYCYVCGSVLRKEGGRWVEQDTNA